ncbi:hypothetical protein QT343_25650 [Escherichia coli]|nr:hypothetical protein [Escherichia coli]
MWAAGRQHRLLHIRHFVAADIALLLVVQALRADCIPARLVMSSALSVVVEVGRRGFARVAGACRLGCWAIARHDPELIFLPAALVSVFGSGYSG